LAQVAFAAPPQGVSVGELAEVNVQLPASSEGMRLPNAAIQRQAGQAGVWRLGADGKPTWMPVTLGASGLDGTVRVNADGLADGDRVVQHSQKPVQAGMRLQVVDSLVPGTSQGPVK